MQKGTVLSVEDDENLQMVIAHYLEEDGYTVNCAGTVKGALENIATQPPNVVLLDLVLPDGEGLSLIPMFRSGSAAAIIVVSGKDSTTEKIVCLEMGADDYMTKPFEMRELSARIKAVLRRTEQAPVASTENSAKDADRLLLGKGWYLDRTQYQLFDDKAQSVELTTGEFRLLEALVLSCNRALSREQLYDLTRNSGYDVFDRAVDIQIARIRKKIGDDAKPPQIIRTVRGIGYMYCGEVTPA
jgi:two-component system, OmpR family, response regulator